MEKFLNNRFLTLYIIPFILGSLTTLSFEPFNYTLINFIIFPLFFFFIIYINRKSKNVYRKRPYKINLFIYGLLFGFGFYLSGISWITNSLTFDENFKNLIPFALILIPLFLGLFLAFTVLIVGPYLKFEVSSIILFSASIAISDYLRSYIFTGFPWNLWAYSTTSLTEILQIINVIGLYSYNLILITLFTLPIILLFQKGIIKKTITVLSVVFFILSLYIYGNYEINKNNNLLKTINEKVLVRIVS